MRRAANQWANSLSLIAGVVAFLCSSCSGRQTTKSEMEGTWIPNASSQALIRTVAAKCQIVLRADGTFTASVPDYLMKTSDQASGLIMVGTGGWSLLKAGQGEVKLNFADVDGQRVNWGAKGLQVRTAGKDLQLFFWIGEEGEKRFVFERQPTLPTAPK